MQLGQSTDAPSPADNAAPTLPSPTLPKGGGAIAAIGEKFVSNAHMGTGSFSIPVFASPGRGGVGPALALSYDAGTGNGPYGLGWSLSVPNIARKTEKGLPRYDDAVESDVFVLSGAEDLVPTENTTRNGETVIRYRPRVEGGFARIERHVRGDGTQYWVAWTRDNLRSVYGYSAEARLADPVHPLRVFRWMLEWTDDDKGNVIAYVYKPEDGIGVASVLPEQNRGRTNLYLKAIAYANPQPRASRELPPLDLSPGRAAALASWPLVVLFDYGEHDAKAPTLSEANWPVRHDPFSSYRSGFEVRTHRLCQRILMMHKFDALGPSHQVVRSTELGYKQTAAISYLTSATRVGWKPKPGGYDVRAMPPLTMTYGEVGALNQELHVLDDEGARNLPDGIDDAYSLLDYDGEGLPGVLCEDAGRGWSYKRPEGRDDRGGGHLGRPHRVDTRPSGALSDGFRLQDVNADGIPDLVRVGAHPEGVFERVGNDWTPFRPFPAAPRIDWDDPNLRFIDLDGDGLPDVLITDRDIFRWHRGLGRDGFADEARTPKPLDQRGPMPLFASEREAVLLADMTGDGLSDIVHVQNGSVCYWPNLGYGRFGRRVQMAESPRLDTPEGFDPRRIRIADIDGTGTGDLLYLRADGVHIFLNQAGNSFAAQPPLRGLPAVHDFARFTLIDLWGTGTACLVWSSALPADRLRPLRWVDLLAGHKPHLLEMVDNGLGARTTIEHAPSTRFYLRDRAAGLPWITKLPMPVQVVASVTVEDIVSETKLVTSYRYHHGFYDGAEREFRGFGMVEQQDTLSLAEFAGKSHYPRGLDETLHIPPSLTKTWFHTGSFVDARAVSQQLANEYFPGTPALPDSVIAGAVFPSEEREARRALRGHPLRQEVYALDGNDAPYVVTENNYTLRLERARGGGRYAVFSVFPRESLRIQLERNLGDPRVRHEIVLVVGPYGDVEERVTITYPRAPLAMRRPEQERLWALHTRASFVHHDVELHDYRVGIATEVVSSELAGLSSDHILSFVEVGTGAAAAEQPWVVPDQRSTPGRWLVQHTQIRYWDDTATTELAANAAGVRALVSRTLTLALTRGFLDTVWNGRESATKIEALAQQAGYLVEGDLYWAFTGSLRYDSLQFFLPISFTNPFLGVASIHYETPAVLLPDSMRDTMGNQTRITNDYRVLAPSAVTDPNDTVTTVETDPLGIVIATRISGSAGEGGDVTAIDYAFGAPSEVHVRTSQQFGAGSPIEEQWIYSDGLGREVQRKQLTTAGPEDPEDPSSATLSPRYVATGRTVFNNKGLPVKKYEPYFSASSSFDVEAGLATRGVTPILQYDPVGRLIRTDLPNGTYSKVVFDAWTQESWDAIDTLEATTPWYADRITGTYPREPALEKAAAAASLPLAGTPTVVHLDALGRTVATVRDAGTSDPQRFHETSQELDIEGALLSVRDPRFINATERLQVIRQVFDIAGRTLFTDSVDAGRRWTLPDALGQSLYTWRASSGDPGAFRTRHEYDVARRLIGLWEQPDGGTGEVLRERIIYRDGSGIPNHGAGRVFAELDGAGLLTYAYEFRGHLETITRHALLDGKAQADWTSLTAWNGDAPLPPSLDAVPLVVTHAWDAAGREVTRTASVGSRASGTIKTSYDIAGRLTTVEADLPLRGTTPFADAIDYDAKGRRHQARWGHGAITTYHYDPLTYRLESLQTEKAGSEYQALVYAYDPVGNITAIRDDAQDTLYFAGNVIKPERRYTYDALYRLRSAVGREHLSQAAPDQRTIPDPLALPVADPADLTKVVSYLEQYSYDPSGNIAWLAHKGASNWTRAYTVDAASNRLFKTTTGGFDSMYSYDTRGNTTSMAHLSSMTWNERDQLIAAIRTRVGNGVDPASATPDNAAVYFAYDVRGLRARKTTATSDRIYVDGFELYRDSAVERETLHIQDGARRLALVETRTSGSGGPQQTVRYQHDDHLGSAVLELDPAATPLSYEEFHPYGTTALYAGLAPKRYRSTGMERDEETGLLYQGARYYSPWLGRWSSADPTGIGDGANLYSYVRSNPVRLIDPSGLEGVDPAHEEAAEKGEEAQEQLVKKTGDTGKGFHLLDYAYDILKAAVTGARESSLGGASPSQEALIHTLERAEHLEKLEKLSHVLSRVAAVAGGVFAALETALENKQKSTAGKVADPLLTGGVETFFAITAGPVMAGDAAVQLGLGARVRTARRYSVAGHLTFPIHGAVAIIEGNEAYKRELLEGLLSGDAPILWSGLAKFFDTLGRAKAPAATAPASSSPSSSKGVSALQFEPDVIFRFDPVVIHRRRHHRAHHHRSRVNQKGHPFVQHPIGINPENTRYRFQ